MRVLEVENIKENKLIEYGFKKINNEFVYSKRINSGDFEVEIIYKDNKLVSKVIDLDTSFEYILVDNPKSTGAFVNSIREEYEKLIEDIKREILDISPFHNTKASSIEEYIKEKYDSNLEFLWEKFPDVSIWRNKNNNKWFGLIMAIEKNKLGIEGNEIIETITLKYQKDENDKIVDNIKIFKGYHMNKRSWITINLDSDITLKEIYNLVDNSYNLSIK